MQGLLSMGALHWGEEGRSEQTWPQANFTLHTLGWATGESPLVSHFLGVKARRQMELLRDV